MESKEELIAKYREVTDEILDVEGEEINPLRLKINELYEEMHSKENIGNAEKQSAIKKEIENLYAKIRKINDERLYKLYDIQYRLESKIKAKDLIVVAESSEIELRVAKEELINTYYIYSKELSIEIGTITYRGTNDKLYEGDISYRIEPDYSGHSYAYKALCLLSDYLYRNGVDHFVISAHRENVASVKTIEKYGGIMLPSDRLYPGIKIYSCDTREKESEKEH